MRRVRRVWPDRRGHGRPEPRGPVDFERSVEQLCSFAHRQQAESICLSRGIEAEPVVADRDLYAAVVFAQFDQRSLGVPVGPSVDQRLLRDPIQADLDLGLVAVEGALLPRAEVHAVCTLSPPRRTREMATDVEV